MAQRMRHTEGTTMRSRLIITTVLVALVASGCFKVRLDIDVADDGSGTVSGLVALDAEGVADLAGSMLSEDEGPDDLCEEFEADQGLDDPRFNARPYDEDGFCGVEFSASFPAEEFDSALLSEFADGGVTLRRDGGGWLFEMPLDTDEMLGDTEGAEMLPGFDEFFSDAEYVVRVKLPGRQVDHNADFIDKEGFAVWKIDIMSPPAESLRLRTEPGETIFGSKSATDDDGGSNVVVIILVVVAILLVLGLAVWYLKRNRASADTAAPAETTAPPRPAEPPADPAPAPTAPPEATIIENPTPEQAMGSPVWDPGRNAYVQWDPAAGRWLRFDDAAGEWIQES